MLGLRYAAIALFIAAFPVFLIATNARWVINAPVLYSYGFDKYEIPDRTQIDRAELLLAAKQIRDYFNNDEELLDVRVRFLDGVRRSVYNGREVLHMKDVKGLVRGVYWVQWLTGVYLAAFAVVGLASARRAFLPRMGRYVIRGGAATISLVLIVGLGALFGFERLFLAFHLVSFSNDLWQADYSQGDYYLTAMFPEGFFLDATIWIAASTVAEAFLLSVAALVLLRWWPGRMPTDLFGNLPDPLACVRLRARSGQEGE
jgi:integral membrane protein (TIGR01906 family)